MGLQLAEDRAVARQKGRQVARRTVDCVATLRAQFLPQQIFTADDVAKVTGLDVHMAERLLRWLESDEIIETKKDECGDRFFYIVY